MEFFVWVRFMFGASNAISSFIFRDNGFRADARDKSMILEGLKMRRLEKFCFYEHEIRLRLKSVTIF